VLKGLNFTHNLVAHAVVGGLASVAAGGKFANGAVTAAFGYLFNQAGKGSSDGRPLTQGEKDILSLEFPGMDVDSVRIYYGQQGNAAYSPANFMDFPTWMSGCRDFSTCSNGEHVDWFVHEGAHVWQWQNNQFPMVGFVLGGTGPRRIGEYLTLEEYYKTPTPPAWPNTEKAADWHMWHCQRTYRCPGTSCDY
jgi:hypothetical protein